MAELRFGFGRRREASEALETSHSLAPENPYAHALTGFIAAGDSDLETARRSFDKALEIDGVLATAWLGRGLISVRQGRLEDALADLQMATVLDPRRSFLRSYLSRGFSAAGGISDAAHELSLAERFDPNDPTPAFFSALLNQQLNRFGTAIGDLEKALELNDNRMIYRSGFLLDQDRAVRRANLAVIYLNSGLQEISVREANRAVDDDYTNFSSHLFLANAFDALRESRRINLRFETTAANQLLLANLLAPAGTGTLGQHVSLQEYTPLLNKPRTGFNAQTTYLSHGGGELHQVATAYGSSSSSSYAVDVDYFHFDGYFSNREIERLEVSAQAKYQLSPRDTAFAQVIVQDLDSGDAAPVADISQVDPDFRRKESQLPIILVGWR